jgi:hypothetical protein
MTRIQREINSTRKAKEKDSVKVKKKSAYQLRKEAETQKKLEALKVNKEKFGDILLGKGQTNRIITWLKKENLLTDEEISA